MKVGIDPGQMKKGAQNRLPRLPSAVKNQRSDRVAPLLTQRGFLMILACVYKQRYLWYTDQERGTAQ